MERSFHIRNRQELYRTIPDHSLFVCFAGRILPQSADAEYPFVANRNFAYLTGLDGAEVHDFVFLARKEGEAVEETVFALPPDAMAERWTGRRLKEEEIRSRSGVERVLPAERFSAVFHAAAERSRTVALDLWKKSPPSALPPEWAGIIPGWGSRTATGSSAPSAPSRARRRSPPCARPRRSPRRGSRR